MKRAIQVAACLTVVCYGILFLSTMAPREGGDAAWPSPEDALTYHGQISTYMVTRVSGDHFATTHYRVEYFLYNGRHFKDTYPEPPTLPDLVGGHFYTDGRGDIFALTEPPNGPGSPPPVEWRPEFE